MSFKLLAIRPLQGCNPNLLKNLKPNQIYKFYNDYHYYISDLEELQELTAGEITKIKHETHVPENLFWLGDHDNPTKVSVSAIVGRNGSGKSALVELLVAAVVKMSLAINKDFIKPETLYDSDKEDYEELVALFNNSTENDLDAINVEIYFEHKAYINPNGSLVTKVRRLTLNKNNIFITDFIHRATEQDEYIAGDNHNLTDRKTEQEFYETEVNFLEDFFYTMVINYSHYGYNTDESGEWLKGVFHKNDSYQLPVVINPYREKGNIDINSEKYLAASRFLVNILQEKELRHISENKVITHISIELDKDKFNHWDDELKKDRNNLNRDYEKIEILEKLGRVFFDKPNYRLNSTTSIIFPYLRDYLLLKLKKITKYKRYKKYSIGAKKSIFLHCENPKEFLFTFPENLQAYFEDLSNDSSHVTDKLRQALFFLDKFYLDDKEIFIRNEIELLLDIDTLNKRIEEALREDILEDEYFLFTGFTIRQSLPSIFKVNYFFEDRYSENNFHQLSSGEKQKIYSIHSVLYHLRNLKSVEAKKENELQLIYYKNINVIFDEIELYSHPEFQKQFLNDFLNSLSAIHLRYDSVNVLFITHSPFILSDIPKENVLFLSEGTPQKFERMNTFGANITDLLADSFFINDGIIGNFAKNKIDTTIQWLNNILDKKEQIPRLDKNSHLTNIISLDEEIQQLMSKEIEGKNKMFNWKLIQLIDEPILKQKLEEMYHEATGNFMEREIIQRRIKELQDQLKDL